MRYLEELNDTQRKAVEATEGPLLVLAGAGAGKTKTVTHRILHLINKGVAPENILAVTFTNKAAREMQERITALLAKEVSINTPVSMTGKPFVATFHGLGAFIIKENYRAVGVSKYFSIYDRADSKRLVKEALEKLGFNPKDFDPSKILGIISREKGNFVSAESYSEQVSSEASRSRTGYLAGVVAEVWLEYEKALRKENALDFDDLLLVAAKLLEREEIRKVYAEKWQYIHIDEYQDTNKVQYKIALSLAGEHHNICVVGDTDQCLAKGTKIKMANGKLKVIEDIRDGDYIMSNYGSGDFRPAKVIGVKRRKLKGDIIKIETSSGKILESTPDHIHFAGYRLGLTPQTYLNYLMYKKGIGWRIGTTSIYTKGQKKPMVGLVQRSNQEHADSTWVVATHKTAQEARKHEYVLSLRYQIPTLPFVARKGVSKNGYVHDPTVLKEIFSPFETEKSAPRLLVDLGLSLDHPHHIPQVHNANRRNINVVLCADRRGLTPMHNVSIFGNDDAGKEVLKSLGFSVRTSKTGTNNWRFETSLADYGKACFLASKITAAFEGARLVLRARLGDNKNDLRNGNSLPCIPAGSVMPGMALFSEDGYEVVSSVSKVKEAKKEVFDIDVDKTHNFLANGIVTHNCIYGWRGASIKNILNFERDFPKSKTLVLEENYRSTQTILAIANRIIERNKLRQEKRLVTRNSLGEKAGVFEALTENHEAQFVAEKAKELHERGIPYSEMAVLYRANFQSRVLEEEFLSRGVPYHVLGTRFFERKEIKDVMAFLRYALNPENISDLKRIINVPPRGIGKTTLLKIVEGKEETLPVKMKINLNNFRNLLQRIKDFSLANPISKTVNFIIQEAGILSELSKSEEDVERKENLKELFVLASRYDAMPPEDGALKFLEDVSLASDQDSDKEEKEAVRLMTVHASKGLEFAYVFITGLEEGLFPHDRDQDENVSQEEAEEERRLFYVALTRAKKKLFLTYAQTRTIFGSRGVNIPSEFVLEIPDEYLEREFSDYKPKRRPLLDIEF